MTRLGTNIGASARDMLLAMQANAVVRDQAASRLATGLRVASPLDGPSAFFTAARSNARADRIEGILDGLALAQRTLEAADAANRGTGRLLDEMERLIATGTEPTRTFGQATVEADAAPLFEATGLTATTDVRTLRGFDAVDGNYIAVFPEGGAAAVHDYGRDGFTVADIMATINASGNGVTASLNAGRLELTAAAGVSIGVRTSTLEATPGLEGTIYRGPHGNSLGGTNAVVANPANRVAGFTATSINLPQGAPSGSGISASINGTLGAMLGADAASLDAAVAGQNNQSTVFELEGEIVVGAAGTYSIRTASDDGIRIYIDGTEVAGTNAWNVSDTRSVTLTAGRHDIRILAWGGFGPNGFYVESDIETGAGNGRVMLDADVLQTRSADVDTALPGQLDDETVARLNVLRTQIAELAPDAHYTGFNGATQTGLDVAVNERDTRYAPTLQAIDTAGLGLDALSANDWKGAQTVRGALETARARVRTHGAQTSAALGIVTTRLAFNEDLIATLRGGADALTLADANEESAILLAANTRIELGRTALSMNAANDRTAQNVLAAARL